MRRWLRCPECYTLIVVHGKQVRIYCPGNGPEGQHAQLVRMVEEKEE